MNTTVYTMYKKDEQGYMGRNLVLNTLMRETASSACIIRVDFVG